MSWSPYAGNGGCGGANTGALLTANALCAWPDNSVRARWTPRLNDFAAIGSDASTLYTVSGGNISAATITGLAFNSIDWIAAGADGSIYAFDSFTNRVYAINPTTAAVTATSVYLNGVGFTSPLDIGVGVNWVYLADSDDALVRVDRATMSTYELLVGNDVVGGSYTPQSGFTDGGIGTSTCTAPEWPTEVGNYVYFLDANSCLRRTDLTTRVTTTVAGSGTTSGHVDANGTAARFNIARSLAYDGTYFYCTDENGSGARTLRRIDATTFEVTTTYVATTESPSNIGIADDGKLIAAIDENPNRLYIQVPNVGKRGSVVVNASATATVGTPGRNDTVFGQRLPPDVGIIKYGLLGLLDANAATTAVGQKTTPGVADLTAGATLNVSATGGAFYTSGTAVPTAVRLIPVDSTRALMTWKDPNQVTTGPGTEPVMGRLIRSDGAGLVQGGTSVVMSKHSNGTRYPVSQWDVGSYGVNSDGTVQMSLWWTFGSPFSPWLNQNTFVLPADPSVSFGVSSDIWQPVQSDVVTPLASEAIPGTQAHIFAWGDYLSGDGSSRNMGMQYKNDTSVGTTFYTSSGGTENLYESWCILSSRWALVHVREIANPASLYGLKIKPILVATEDAQVPNLESEVAADYGEAALSRLDDNRALLVYTVGQSLANRDLHAMVLTITEDGTVTTGPSYCVARASVDRAYYTYGSLRAVTVGTNQVLVALLGIEKVTGGSNLYPLAMSLGISGNAVTVNDTELLDATPQTDSTYILFDAVAVGSAAAVTWREEVSGQMKGRLALFVENSRGRASLEANAHTTASTYRSGSARSGAHLSSSANLSVAVSVTVIGTTFYDAVQFDDIPKLQGGATVSVHSTRLVSGATFYPASAANDLVIGKGTSMVYVNYLGGYVRAELLPGGTWESTRDATYLSTGNMLVFGDNTWSGRQSVRAWGTVYNSFGTAVTDYDWGPTNTANTVYTGLKRTGTTDVWVALDVASGELVRANESGVLQSTSNVTYPAFKVDNNAIGRKLHYTVPTTVDRRHDEGLSTNSARIRTFTVQPLGTEADLVTGTGNTGDIVIRTTNDDVFTVLHGVGVKHYNSSGTLQATYTWEDEPVFHAHRSMLAISGNILYMAAQSKSGQERIYFCDVVNKRTMGSVPIPAQFANGIISALWTSSFAYTLANKYGQSVASATASLTAVGSRKATGVAALTASATLSATGGVRYNGTAALSAEATTTGVAIVRKSGAALLSVTTTTILTAVGYGVRRNNLALLTSTGNTLTAIGGRRQVGLANLTATGTTLTATGALKAVGQAILTAEATIAVSPYVRWKASAALSADATTTATAVRKVAGLAALSAGATVTAVGLRKVPATAALSADASVALITYTRWFAQAPLTADATVTTVGVRKQLGSTTLSADATTTAVGIRGLPGIVDASAGATLTAAGLRRIPGLSIADGSATATASALATRLNNPAVLTAEAIVTAVGLRKQFGIGTVTSSQANLTAVGVRKQLSSAALSASATVTAVATPRAPGQTDLRGDASTTATALARALATVLLSATATTTSVALRKVLAAAALDATATVDVVGTRVQLGGAAVLDATASLTATGEQRQLATSDLSSAADLTVSATLVWRNNTAALSAGATTTAVGLRKRFGVANITSKTTTILTAVATARRFALANISAGATTTAVPYLGQFGVIDASAGATASAQGLGIRYALADLVGQADVAPTAVRVQFAQATLTSDASVTPTAYLRWFAQADVSAAADTTVIGRIRWFALVDTSASAELTVEGRYKWFGDSALSAGATVTAVGLRKRFGVVNATSSATCTAVGKRKQFALAALTTQADVVVIGRNKWFGDTSVDASATCAATGVQAQPGVADLVAAATLAPTPYVRWFAQTALVGEATLTPTALAVVSGAAALVAEARGFAITEGFALGRASLTGGATLAAVATQEQSGTATTSATATVEVSGSGLAYGVPVGDASAVLTASATRLRPASVSTDAAADAVVAAYLVQYATVSLDASVDVTVDAVQVQLGDVATDATASAAAIGIGVARDASALDATAVLSATATRVQLSAASLDVDSTLIATSNAIAASTAACTASATSTVAGHAVVSDELTLTSTATSSASASGVVSGTWTLTATATTAGSAARIVFGVTDLFAEAAVSSAAMVQVLASALVEASADTSADAKTTAFGDSAMSAQADLQVTSVRVQFSDSSLAAAATILLTLEVIVSSSMAADAAATLVTSGTREVPGDVALEAQATFEIIEHLVLSGLVVMESAGDVSADSTALSRSAADLSADADVVSAAVGVVLAMATFDAQAVFTSEGIGLVPTSLSLSGDADFSVSYNPFRFGVVTMDATGAVGIVDYRVVFADSAASAAAVVAPIQVLHLTKRYAEPEVDISISGLAQSIDVLGRDLTVEVVGPNVIPEAKGQEVESTVLEQTIETRTDESLDILI